MAVQRNHVTSLRWWLLGIAVVSCALLVVLVLGQRAQARAVPQAKVAPPDSAGNALEELEQKQAQLQRRIEQLEQERLLQAAAPAATASAEGAGNPPEAPPDLAEAHDREIAHEVASLNHIIESEPVDSAWAVGYERGIRAALASAADGGHMPEVESLTCRTSLCRMELKYTTVAEASAFASNFRAAFPEASYRTSALERDKDGQFSSVLHLVRPGYPIPNTEAN